MATLELKGVSLAFGGLKVVDGLDLHVAEGEIVSVIGPNGAGKTTLFNLITGIYRPAVGRHPARRRDDRRARAAPDQPPRHLAHVPDAAALPQHVGRGERDDGRLRAYPFRDLPLDAAHTGHAARGAGDQAARPREARVLRRAADGVPVEPAGVLALVRKPSPTGDCARDRDQPAHPAARRARGRHEPEGDARDHRSDRQAARRGRVHDPRDRARHARRRRASPIASSRSTTASRSPKAPTSRLRPTRRWSRPTSVSGRWSANERVHRVARARRRRHLLRPDPHPARALDHDRAG